MLSELIMAVYGWNEVWAPSIGDPDNPAPGNDGRHRPLNAFKCRGFYVGVWTGPDGDLICTRRTDWKPDAERYKSPAGRTIFDATLRALAVRLCGDASRYLQSYPTRQWERSRS